MNKVSSPLVLLSVLNHYKRTGSIGNHMAGILFGCWTSSSSSSSGSSSSKGNLDLLKNALNKMKISKTSNLPLLDEFGRTELFTTDLKSGQDGVKLNVWNRLSDNDKKAMRPHKLKNGFDEMILATEQGKLWHYPIDNEQGLKEDASFQEHVFLDHFLEGFPKSGPIRNFMELIISGLASNPHMTVNRKHEIIEWYRRYFDGKKELYKSSGLDW